MTTTIDCTTGATGQMGPFVAYLFALDGDRSPTLTDLAVDIDTSCVASLTSRSVLERELRSSFDRVGIREPMSAMQADADAAAREAAPHR